MARRHGRRRRTRLSVYTHGRSRGARDRGDRRDDGGGRISPLAARAAPRPRDGAWGLGDTATPIKHVIVIIGENHTFDNVFATYQPPAGPARTEPALRGHRHRVGRARAERRQGRAADGDRHDDLPDRPQETGPYATLPQPNTTYVSPACDGQAGRHARRALPGQPAQRALPDHQVRPVLRRPRPVRRSARASSTAPSSATRSTASTRCTRRSRTARTTLDLGPRDGRRLQRRAAAEPVHRPVDRPGRARHGLLQHGTRRRPGAQLPGPPLRDVGQLPPGGDGRHRRQPHRARHRRRRLLPGRERQRRPRRRRARSRTPIRSPARTTSTRRTATARAARPTAAATRTARTTPRRACRGVFELPEHPAVHDVQQRRLRPGPLLPAQQLQPGLQRRRNAEHLDVHRPAAALAADDRRRAVGPQHQLGLLRRGLRQRQPGPELLRHLRSDAVLEVDHDQPGAAGEHPARTRGLRRRGDQRHAAGGVVPEAGRRRRTSRLLDAGRVRGVRHARRRRGPEQPEAVEEHRDLRHLRRGRRLLRLRLHPADLVLR